jgi:hypothetical protein
LIASNVDFLTMISSCSLAFTPGSDFSDEFQDQRHRRTAWGVPKGRRQPFRV